MTWKKLLSLVFWALSVFQLLETERVWESQFIPTSVLIQNVFLFFLLSGVGRAFGGWDKDSEQRKMDHKAEQDYQKVKDGTLLEFGLYLRPFRLDTQSIRETMGAAFGIVSPAPYVGSDKLYLEDTLRQVLGAYPVLGIGPSERGFGKIKAKESEWMEDFVRLADTANILFVIPFDSAGCMRELQWILEHHLLAKTVFIIPPRALIGSYLVKDQVEEDWKRIQTSYDRSLRLPLPDLRENKWEGNVVRYSQAGSILKQTEYVMDKLTSSSRRNLGAAVFSATEEILPHLAVYSSNLPLKPFLIPRYNPPSNPKPILT